MRWLLLGLGAITFLAAAKAHGRQLRLERELAGIWQVSFGGDNPPFVEALWQRERTLYWATALGLAVLTLALRWLGRARLGEIGASWSSAAVLHVLLPLIGAFVLTGVLSLVRLLRATPAAAPPPAAWWSTTAWGTALWWGLTVSLVAGLCMLLSRRPA